MKLKKNKEPITEESLRKKVSEKTTLEDSIANIMNTHECTEIIARKAIDEVLNEQDRWVEREVIQKIKNMKEIENSSEIIANR